MASQGRAPDRRVPHRSVPFPVHSNAAHRSALTPLGVADEYNCLREGEVFCQIQDNEDAEPRVVLADVIVCRAPACE